MSKNNNSLGNRKLTISVLISNNYDNVKKCLDSVKNLMEEVDSELILTDTGCDDNVRELIEQYSEHIIDFEWCKDFSAARNVGLYEAKGEWFLYIDDDEWFEDTKAISHFLNSEESNEVNVCFYVQRNYLDVDGVKYQDHYVDRLLRVNPKLHFENRIHEAYIGIEIGEKKCLDTIANHFGYAYANEKECLEKYERNQELLELECEEKPNDMRLRYQMVINPLSINAYNICIDKALDAIEIESNSEYWDACHNIILFCLECKEDWEMLAEAGEAFLKKNIYPYDRFGIMQKMIKAYWNLGNFARVCELGKDALHSFEEYKNDLQIFNRNQLMRVEFVQKEEIYTMLANLITAASVVGDEELIVEMSTKVAVTEIQEMYSNEGMRNWIESVISMIMTSKK